MTREEAIKELENMKKFNYTLAPLEVFDMAIEALEQEPINEIVQNAYEDGKKDGYVQAKVEQEPCDDCISRQATLEPYNVLKDTDTLCVALIRANIMQQPSVKQDTVPFDFELYQAGLMDMPKEMIDVLDKIRAEIGAMSGDIETIADVLQIIDKYRKESEE